MNNCLNTTKKENLSIDINETILPKKLQKGNKSIGLVTLDGITKMAYVENDYNIGNLPAAYIGSQGSGKSISFINYAIDCVKAGESLFVIDFIKDCDLSNNIEKAVPKDKLVVLDLASKDRIQGLGYNEIVIEDSMDDFEKLKLANLQAMQTLSLVDSMNLESPLTSRMRRFLNAAANVVFVQKDSNIKSVINCLEDYQKRERYIRNLNPSLREYLEDEIRVLEELDEYSKSSKYEEPQKVGTFYYKISDILERIAVLRENIIFKSMHNKDVNENVNFMQCMEEGKIVLIKMRESEFPTKIQKNVLINYFTSKIWLANQIRSTKYNQPKRSNILIDELFQSPACMKNLDYMLPQARKFGLKIVISVIYFSQLNPIIDTLEASGASFFFLTGCTEDDFSRFKDKLPNFQYEDIRDMPRFHSMCLVKYSDGYASFIAKLPPPPKCNII